MTICDNCIHRNVCADEGHYDEGLSFCADKIEERPTEVNCSHCDYWKFSRAIIHGFADLMAAHGIESIEELEEELHRLNKGKQEAENE